MWEKINLSLNDKNIVTKNKDIHEYLQRKGKIYDFISQYIRLSQESDSILIGILVENNVEKVLKVDTDLNCCFIGDEQFYIEDIIIKFEGYGADIENIVKHVTKAIDDDFIFSCVLSDGRTAYRNFMDEWVVDKK